MSSTEDIKKEVAGVETEHVKTEAESAPTAAATATKPAEVVEDVPDPDEDDLDDLDDMLDEFSATKIDTKKPAESPSPQPTGPTAPAAPSKDAQPSSEDPLGEADFAEQLQAGMAELLGELGKSPDMQAQFEDMFKQMTGEAIPEGSDGKSGEMPKAPGNDSSRSKSSPADAANDASFQDTIRRTMERMQTSGDQATAAANSSSEDDFMAEILKQMSSGDLNAEGSEEDFSKMLMGMMEQLTNKEILYEPMKELNDKFPAWLEKHAAATAAQDLKRYEEQRTLVSEIVTKFEEKTYSDSNSADREYIVDRMQKMQAAGSPPSDLVGDMASAQEAFAGQDDQCNPQ